MQHKRRAITALLAAGLQLTSLKEYPYSNGFKPFDQMQALPNRRWSYPKANPICH